MPQNRDAYINLAEYRNTLVIKETLNEINTGIFFELEKRERNLNNLIAEFAATFYTRVWAEKKGWCVRKGVFWIQNASSEDMKLITAAQKAGGVFEKIKVGSKSGKGSCLCFV